MAALAFWMLRESYRERLEDRKTNREALERAYQERLMEQCEHREDVRSLVIETRQCIDRNSQVLAETLNEIRSLAQAIRGGQRGV